MNPKVYLLLTLFSFLSFFAPKQIYAQNMMVSGFADFNFGTWDGSSGNFELVDSVCVYKSSGNASYFVTGDGSGAGGSFALTDGSNSLPYVVRWAKAGANFATLTAGVPRRRGGANRNATDCGGVDSAEMMIRFTDSDLASVPSSTFSGTLTITVEPT